MPEVTTTPEPKELTPFQNTTQTIANYTKKLANDKKAQEFAARVTLMARQNPKIAAATPESLLTAMMACVQLDLMPNTPEGLAYVIPYGNSVQFQIGYKGIVELAYRTGVVRKIDAELVFPEDTFKVSLGTNRQLTHEPDYSIDRTDYKKVTHVYATAVLTTGETVFDVMSRKEVNKVQTAAKASSTDSPWHTWWGRMAKKTAVKSLAKLLPSSSEDNRFKQAIEWDSLAEAGKLSVAEEGEIVEVQKDSVPAEAAIAIMKAENNAELEAILGELTPAQRKNATELVNDRIQELVKANG